MTLSSLNSEREPDFRQLSLSLQALSSVSSVNVIATVAGLDGGTCINEAALVAAGFDYRPIRSAEDMPACFSRSICRFAMFLNDTASDEERQRLLPFVIRLACADTEPVERAREPFEKALEVFEGALAIGRPADLFPLEEVNTRMDRIRAQATTPTSIPDMPVFAKIKKWLTAKPETAIVG